VAGHGRVVVGDRGDQSLAEPFAAVLRTDRQKEDVPVPADRREADQPVGTPVDVAVDRGPLVRVLEKPPSLPQDAVLAPDALLELPRPFGAIV